MKTIAVILPINNSDVLTQADLDSYSSSGVNFKLHYIDTTLRELNTAEDVALVKELTIKKIMEVVKDGASAVIIYAFGELGVHETKDVIQVPIMALGTEAIAQASKLSRKNFTILPGMLAHNGFLQEMVNSLEFGKNFVVSQGAPEVSPAQLRKDTMILDKLALIAENEITQNDVDTFTLGCGSFIGLAEPLEKALQNKYGSSIQVVDPIAVTFNYTKSLI